MELGKLASAMHYSWVSFVLWAPAEPVSPRYCDVLRRPECNGDTLLHSRANSFLSVMGISYHRWTIVWHLKWQHLWKKMFPVSAIIKTSVETLEIHISGYSLLMSGMTFHKEAREFQWARFLIIWRFLCTVHLRLTEYPIFIYVSQCLHYWMWCHSLKL